eukprot:jgi/Tetstr1/465481/TSEL_010165.t1
MSEVASIYLQGRMSGWFKRLFASARLVAPIKKLGASGAPDIRHVTVRDEAERRAAERAVVDNMKEAYVSLLAPSQLGVGISAGDSMLIHGVRLIAEKLSPGAVIGAPLATASFCVGIHPEVEESNNTMEATWGAARFTADDGYLVSLPEHIWPALHGFRTSIKASVGPEVRFDKMHAYNADMEDERREATARIERCGPELDGHHGIPVLNVRLGSPWYVHAYVRGKAEELHEEAFADAVDATVLAAVERVLGASFHPSTYGIDTNPVVTDFLAELYLHNPDDLDPTAAEAATLNKDAMAMARSRLHFPTGLKAAGIRRMATVRDAAAFIGGCINDILPMFLITILRTTS